MHSFFYRGIEAQGKILEILFHKSIPENRLDHWRRRIMDRLWELLPAKQAQIAIPLVVGEQRVVSDELYDVYRRSGIAHVLSVSGFHMVLLAGFVFFFVRGILAFIPWIALRFSTKKMAAITAFGVTWLYLLLSGNQIPALRAFLMITLVFLGVLTNRKTVSLYTLMVVGFCVLLWNPEWILSISFQLSFVAVMVLVSVFEVVQKHLPKTRVIHWFLAACMANVLISIALLPFVIYHFNQLNPYSVLGNLLTSVFFSTFVMPLLFLGTVMMPFGCETIFFRVAGLILEGVTRVAEIIASWPYSEITIPSFSPIGLLIVGFGLGVLCLLKTKIRWCGCIIVILGLLVGYITVESADILVLKGGKVLAFQNGQKIWFKGKSTVPESVKRWARTLGITNIVPIDQNDINVRGRRIVWKPELCLQTDIAILSNKKNSCKAKDIFYPQKNEVYSIYVEDSVRIKGSLSIDKNRPWGVHLSKKGEKNE